MSWALERERRRFSGWAALVEFRLVQCLEQIREEMKGRKPTGREMRALAAEKIGQDLPLTRKEAAAYLGVSTRKLQRLEAAGKLRRCSGLGGVVRYAARDVLRFASAP